MDKKRKGKRSKKSLESITSDIEKFLKGKEMNDNGTQDFMKVL